MRIHRVLLAVLLMLTCTLQVMAQETPQQRDQRMAWWREAKFGMFIHWGVYAVPAGTYKDKRIDGIGEWIMRNAEIPVAEYRAYAKQFNPTRYNPDAWAALAREAGMRYMVITSKHHDGFALFPTAASKWNVVDATPYGKDLIGPLAEAARKQGLKFGLYYSQAQDWTNPGGAKARLNEGEGWDETHKGSFDTYLQTVAEPQVREILTHYKPDILWWDTPTWMNRERADRLLSLVSLRPGLITNNRLGGSYPGDTETPEQYIPATGYPGRDWEVCMTMNGTWGFKSYDDNWKSTETLVRNLVDIVSKGGNYLLNIGPTADGEIPQASIDRLKEVGAWMKVNGDAIYGTTASPFPFLSWGRATRKGQTLYLHVFNWPENGVLRVPLDNATRRAYLLSDPGRQLATRRDGSSLVINLPPTAPTKYSATVAVEIAGEPVVPKPPTLGKSASASSVLGSDQDAAKAFDGNASTSWSAATADRTGWIEVDLGRATPVSYVSMIEPSKAREKRGQKIRLEYRDGSEWRTILEGDTNGSGLNRSFDPVTAQVFRVTVLEAKDTPSFSEVILYSPE